MPERDLDDEPVLDLGLDPQPAKAAMSANTILDLVTGGGSPQSLLGALSGQLGGGPELDMLVKLMKDNGANEEQMRQQIREEMAAQHREIVDELGDLSERLLEENRAHCRRLERLAAALGACPNCFGEDLLCDQCDGRGRPGSDLPDPAEFNQFVSPALDRVKAEIFRPTRGRPVPRTRSAGIAETFRSSIAGVRP
ncbi:hypothetical protein [Sphingomonas jaspsi]|uniref:hypothetical protein n=1 Tax=Sphingomonas jaspsi TaxID=392409 RepID=UPI0004BA01EC|nr:hypothetical protein [Sphingomonas jaspsi]